MTKLDEQIKKELKKSLKERSYGFHEEGPPQPADAAMRVLKKVYNKQYKIIKRAFNTLSDEVVDNLSPTEYWEECSDWSKDINDKLIQFDDMMEAWFDGLD